MTSSYPVSLMPGRPERSSVSGHTCRRQIALSSRSNPRYAEWCNAKLRVDVSGFALHHSLR